MRTLESRNLVLIDRLAVRLPACPTQFGAETGIFVRAMALKDADHRVPARVSAEAWR